MRFLIVAGVFVAALALGAVSAQETGTIRGRIYYIDHPDVPCGIFGLMFIVPAEEPQPIDFTNFESPFFVDVLCDGTYSRSGLAPGDYLVAYDAAPGFLDGFDDQLLVHWRGTQIFPAKRVTLEPGQDLVVDIAIPVPTPEPTPVPAPNSISGRVYLVEGCDTCLGQYSLLVLPSDVPQPLHYQTPAHMEGVLVVTDGHGNYTSFALADDEYFVVLLSTRRLSSPVDDYVAVTLGTGDPISYPARRVTIANGMGITGIDFVPATPTPIADGPPPQTVSATPSSPRLPNTGGRALQNASGMFVASATLLAAALALGGAALLARRR